MLALLAAFGMLQAYPVAGTQIGVNARSLAPAAAIGAYDLILQLQQARRQIAAPLRS